MTCFSQVVMYGPYEMGVCVPSPHPILSPFFILARPVVMAMVPLICAQPPDHETAYLFREGLYSFAGVPLPAKPARKVLFWVRDDGADRSFTNLQELTAIVAAYNLPFT